MKNVKILLFAGALHCTLLTSAQVVPFKETQQNEQGIILFATVDEKAITPTSPDNDRAFLRSLVNVPQPIEWRLEKTFKDDLGIMHKRYQAYLNGLKIIGGCYVLHINQQGIYAANGSMGSLNKVSPKAALQYADAVAKATTHLKQQALKAATAKTTINVKVTKNEMVIAFAPYAKDKTYRLAYKVKAEVENDPLAEDIYVDAQNGEVINSESRKCAVDVPGPAATRYSGTRTIMANDQNTGGPFILRERRNGVDIITANNRNSTNPNFAIDFTDNDNNWTAAEHGNNQVALDAHWAVETVLDYWRTVRGRNSLDDNGMAAVSYVHYGSAVENCFWNYDTHCMMYGDGFSKYRPLTSLDFVAHEFGHGVCQFTSGLGYSGEAGALNEGFSDIWGAVIEAWAAPNKQRWLIGEDVRITSPGYSRNFQNPNSSATPQPDTYLGQFWADPNDSYDAGGVHINNGILTYWFYLLSEGGSGVNDKGVSYAVTGLGMNAAARIAYVVEQRLSPNANFLTAKNESILAVRDEFGAGSCQEAAVMNAWAAVGIGSAYAGPEGSTPWIVGPGVLCSGSADYTLGCFGGTVSQWSASGNAGIATVTTTANGLKVQRVGDGVIELTAVISVNGVNRWVRKKVTVGAGYEGQFRFEGIKTGIYVSSGFNPCPGETIMISPSFPAGANLASQHQWSFSGPFTVSGNLNAQTVMVTSSWGTTDMESFTYRYYSNVCNKWSNYINGIIINRDCNGGGDPERTGRKPGETVTEDSSSAPVTVEGNLVLAPNPSSEMVTVRTKDNIVNGAIRIIGLNGGTVYQSSYNGQFKKVAVRQLPAGIYLVRIESKGFNGSAKLTIAR